MGFDGAALYDIVVRYASFGDHHTGTEADRATTDWLVGVLGDLGATTELEPFGFDRFAAEAELTVDGAIVPCLPLFYSDVGEVDTTDLEVFELSPAAVGNARALGDVLPRADDGRPLVVAIESPVGLPVQCNRVPDVLLGRPAVVVAQDGVERVRSGARLRFRGARQPGQSANVLATLGDPAAPEALITTPLTGWTPAAGERGTGLAVALALASALAERFHVVFSACAGHELDHIGLRHHLSTRDPSGRPVVHLGASVAACEADDNGVLVLGRQRRSLTTASGATRAAIEQRVTGANWTLLDVEPPWPGEGGTWRDAGAEVLSFLGGSSVFHTADDVPEKATTPNALELAATIALEATQLFLDQTSAD